MLKRRIVPDYPDKTKKIFTLSQAQDLFPVVNQITEEAVKKAAIVEAEMIVLPEASDRSKALEESYQTLLQEWAEKIVALGCEVKGVWLVDFDNGEGYYCWKYPEESLEFFHDYSSGYSGRTPISE
jgi:hypothetical protein